MLQQRTVGSGSGRQRREQEVEGDGRCSYHYVYHEDVREHGEVVARAGDVETCTRAGQCSICGQCVRDGRSGHCPGHLGVLPYLFSDGSQQPRVAMSSANVEEAARSRALEQQEGK